VKGTESEPQPGRRSALAGAATTVRRLAMLAGATLAVCLVTWVLVDATASAKARRRREQAWAKPDWSGMTMHVGGQLLVVVVAAAAGRKVLRLRL
jgi:hypothetical protein